MKGVFTLGIYIAIGITGAAFGQTRVTTTAERITTAERLGPVAPMSAGVKSGNLFEPQPDEPRRPSQSITPPLDRVMLTWGKGGRIIDHRLTYDGYFRAGTKVELRGPCYSACTLILGYLERANLCIAPGAFMAFHAARGEKYANYMPDQTRAMYETWPPEVRRWIDRQGGWEKLPVDGFWTMYDHELWAIGYPRCAP